MRINIPNSLKDLIEHPFAKLVLQESMEIEKSLWGENLNSINKEPIKAPDDLEYYKLTAGYHISQLFSWCQQLVNNVHFINAKTPSVTLKKRSITSYDLLIYHVENYYIRIQSLYDRILNLTDAVFFLGNSPDNINHKTIVDNSFVQMYKIDIELRKINSIIRKYLGPKRNKIIHQEGYKDPKLRELEYYCLFQDGIAIPEEDEEARKYVSKTIKQIAQKIIEDKIPEFESFNSTLFYSLLGYFNKLHKIYIKKSIDILSIKVMDKQYKSSTTHKDRT